MAAKEREETYDCFESRHYHQLTVAGVPKHFWRRLHEKLVNEIFDAGEFFQILEEVNEEGEHSYSVVPLQQLSAQDPNSIFLIDHAWTFRPQTARKQLREVPGLLDRMCAVLNIEERPRSAADSNSDYTGSGDEAQSPSGAERQAAGAEGEPNEAIKRNVSFERKPTVAPYGTNDESVNRKPSDEAGPSTVKERHESLPENFLGAPLQESFTTLSEEERRINEVLRQMWRHIQTYTMRFAEKVCFLFDARGSYSNELFHYAFSAV
ncbi:unnamed protein product [Gongylonema pulchrum]|uniref:Tubulin--tyrosine ligase-like protein 12 n=1 Tax=Gongylonema pulchrum TaxID=637853 RepID=A0A183DYL3_9BILA|nr:unnamed protein product [Gongylonema pulchrum]